jgi:hypothetical protein
MWSSVDSLTTPSWEDEAQAESSHAITKARTPNQTAPLFTSRIYQSQTPMQTAELEG